MSLIEKPTKDKVLIVSEPRSGSTALWTYLWAKYYQNGVGGKPMQSFLEPFNYQFHLSDTGKKAAYEKKADGFMRMNLKRPDDPWLVKMLLPAILPVEFLLYHRKVLNELNGTNIKIDKWYADPDNPTEEESTFRNVKWNVYFKERKVKAVQNHIMWNTLYNDPDVYRIKLYRKDFIASMMSTMDLHVRRAVRQEQGAEEGEDINDVFNNKLDWHARKDELGNRPIYEYPDMSDMTTNEIAQKAFFYQKTLLRKNLLKFNTGSNPSIRFDAEYVYEDIKDELIDYNPIIEFDKDNPMHIGNYEMIAKKSGITVTTKAENYNETYKVLSNAYRRWYRHWPDVYEKKRLDKFSV